MSRSVFEEHDSSRENAGTEASFTPEQNSGGISEDTRRLAGLSAEITGLLSGLHQKVEMSAEQYRSLESAADAKKEELKQLYEIEASATSLASLVEAHRLAQDSFETQMNNQRGLWEKEIEQRAQGEKEYLEALQFRREQEEEEYRRVWAREKDRVLDALREELEALQQEFKMKQEVMEKDFLRREEILKAKEQECDEIIREMEAFISGLGKRVQGHVDAAANLSTEELLAQSSFEDESIGGSGSPMSVEEKDALMEASESEIAEPEGSEIAQKPDSVTVM
jgi:hypothetical protein